MSAPWVSRSISAVASNGVATQLFPIGCVAGADTTATTGRYPPVGGGFVRRSVNGRTEKLVFTPDGINGGMVEIWDVGGVDRGDTNNVNTQATLTDAYLTANGTLLQKYRVTGSSAQATELTFSIHHLEFNKGLAIRFVSGSGAIDVAPYCEGGFMRIFVAGT